MRKFIFFLSFFCAAACLFAADEKKDFPEKFKTDKAAYNLLVFSDWHYTDMKFHTPDPKRMWVMEQAQRYAGLWKDFSLKTLEAANAHEADFAISAGDSLEGYFKSPEAQSEALKELDALVVKYLKRPWVLVPGNHEYSPPAIRDAFFKTAHEIGLMPNSRSFHFRYGKDLYIFWDNISARLAPVKLALMENKDVRYTFLVCHYPVLPSASGSPRWIAFGDEKRDNERKELLNLLAARNVIVLNGHIHTFGISEYQVPEGKITQVNVNSTIDNFKWKTPSKIAMDTEFPFLPKQSYRRVKDIPAMKAFFGEYSGKITRAEFFNAVGYGVLKVDDNGVNIELYSGSDKKPFHSWKIR